MTQKIQMAGLIAKYSKSVTVTKQAAGVLTNGIYTPGAITSYAVNMSIFPVSSKDLAKYEAGTYTTQDKKVYAPVPLIGKRIDGGTVEEITLRSGDTFFDQGDTFEIKEMTDRSDVSNFIKYFAKKKTIKKSEK
jgi:hypothetical protein